jgi:hypothetical protein
MIKFKTLFDTSRPAIQISLFGNYWDSINRAYYYKLYINGELSNKEHFINLIAKQYAHQPRTGLIILISMIEGKKLVPDIYLPELIAKAHVKSFQFNYHPNEVRHWNTVKKWIDKYNPELEYGSKYHDLMLQQLSTLHFNKSRNHLVQNKEIPNG